MSRLLSVFSSGKNPKWLYYLRAYLRYAVPRPLLRMLTGEPKHTLEMIERRKDRIYIEERIAYYCALTEGNIPEDSPRLGEHRPCSPKVYFFDTYEFTRYFPDDYRWQHLAGDVTHVPEYPTIVKSRPLVSDNQNSVLMKLDKVRHFTFVEDERPFREKFDKVLFRGDVLTKQNRIRFLEMYFDHPLCDLGDVSRYGGRAEWKREKLTIREHLDYKFIMALEGNDVASNLKWVMSSQSLAVMPRPTCETWFMEGRLIPNYHYVEIKADFSDLEERICYYIDHPEEAEMIVRQANAYVAQFRDEEREHLISMAVLHCYLHMVNPQ